MTPEEREKAIVAGHMLARLPLLPDAQAALEAMSDEEIILEDHQLTVIIESSLATPASVIGAAAQRLRLVTELVRRRAVKEHEQG